MSILILGYFLISFWMASRKKIMIYLVQEFWAFTSVWMSISTNQSFHGKSKHNPFKSAWLTLFNSDVLLKKKPFLSCMSLNCAEGGRGDLLAKQMWLDESVSWLILWDIDVTSRQDLETKWAKPGKSILCYKNNPKNWWKKDKKPCPGVSRRVRRVLTFFFFNQIKGLNSLKI